MGAHPLNLALRFVLEMVAFTAIAYWGWKQSDHWMRYALAIGLPVLMAIIWGIFNVPGDPSRSGSAPIITPGFIRLIIELGIFAFAAWGLKDAGWHKSCMLLGIFVLFHYVVSYDRVLWLLKQ